MVKTITIREEAYNALKRLKKREQSFSEIIIEIAGEKRKIDICDFFGILKDSEAIEEARKNLKRYKAEADKMAREKEEKLRE
ncbi:antitoxin VapB family protein [Candidatus Pacearchaeota archaeon]|nr:antitoxin VapB family protein [Candidatus Pacearchaeota archaeon]